MSAPYRPPAVARAGGAIGPGQSLLLTGNVPTTSSGADRGSGGLVQQQQGSQGARPAPTGMGGGSLPPPPMRMR